MKYLVKGGRSAVRLCTCDVVSDFKNSLSTYRLVKIVDSYLGRGN
jgi:hypothetical protein